MTIRQQIEQQLQQVSKTPDQSEIKNVLLDALTWTQNNKTFDKQETFEEGVAAALRWVLGISEFEPIPEPYQEQ